MEINRPGSQPSTNGPAETFTGRVRIDPLFDRTDPHIAIVEKLDGKAADWMEPVSDEQYGR